MTGVTEPSYSHGASEVPLLGETIGANLRRVAATHPDREAVVDVPTGQRWTYARFDADTDALARGLIAAGIEAGDRVGIWAPNCPEWVLLQYATAKAGTLWMVTPRARPSSTATWASTRPAGVSSRIVVTGSTTSTMPVSTSTVATPMVPCPHIGRQPETSMNTTPQSASGRVGGCRMAPLIAPCPRGSNMSSRRTSSMAATK